MEIDTGNTYPAELSGSNVLGFHLEGGSVLMVRPSGTEPKIKFYLLAHGTDSNEAESVLDSMKEFVAKTTEDYL